MAQSWTWSAADWRAILAAFARQGGDVKELIRAWRLPPRPERAITLNDHQEAWLRAVEEGSEEPHPVPIGARLLAFRTAVAVG